MKNYLKFVVAVFGITVATFGSITVHAKKGVSSIGAGGGTCSPTTDVCGRTNDGNVITGKYVPE